VAIVLFIHSFIHSRIYKAHIVQCTCMQWFIVLHSDAEPVSEVSFADIFICPLQSFMHRDERTCPDDYPRGKYFQERGSPSGMYPVEIYWYYCNIHCMAISVVECHRGLDRRR